MKIRIREEPTTTSYGETYVDVVVETKKWFQLGWERAQTFSPREPAKCGTAEERAKKFAFALKHARTEYV